MPEPVFTNEREDFVVTFYNGEYPELYPEKMRNEQNDKSTKKTYDKTYDNIEDKILQFCKNAKSTSEITEFCGYKGVDRFKRNYLKPLLKNLAKIRNFLLLHSQASSARRRSAS